MRIMDKYNCEGQMELFDFIERESTSFCWDEDINEIVRLLEKLAESYDLEIGKTEFTVWEHVPHLGYRLWFDVKGTKQQLFREDFRSDIRKIVEYAKDRKVELTPMWGACWFFTDNENEKGRLSFSTLFMDKERQRRR
ncbi:MAG: hypothetical protein IJN54_09200 [Lachnospiraceae bacterium]|nr:hypothetical protein [Lachnospiraceae bacterium]